MGTGIENHHCRSIGGGGSAGGNSVCGVSRPIRLIVVHCTATRVDVDFTQKDLLRCHRARGMTMIGYHFYIRKDGFIWSTRPLERVGAHARGYNEESIGIAYEGGLDRNGLPADTRTERQKFSMRALIRTLKKDFSITRVCGHRDLSPDANGNGVIDASEWLKQCPCFDVAADEWCS
ncbi:MAG: N-acetylmuramoyl-L-alanine amidase [Bacteroides sp.]|nr:N-acetylmuramoyl-L-alanine amidase [Bacteroides sp.]